MRFLYAKMAIAAAFLGSALCGFHGTAFAAENEAQRKELIGTLSVSDLLIQPRFISGEDDVNRFDLDRSYFFFSWKVNNQLSAHFGVGRQELINHNTRLTTNVTNSGDYKDFAFFEAYAQLDSKYGTIRAGLIPLMFGWEGVHKESEWIFPRTLFYGGEDDNYLMQNFGLRDQGVSYFISHKNFYVNTVIHNGENGKDLDGKLWHTATIGWKDKSGLEGALSFANGKYKNGNIDPEIDFAYANAFFGFEFYDLFFLGEGSLGEQEKEFSTTPGEKLKKKFWNWHIDASHPVFTKGLVLLGRYEQYDPDSTVTLDRIQRYILGFGISNELRNSNLYIWAIKNKEEGVDLNNNQIMVEWKVRSLSIF